MNQWLKDAIFYEIYPQSFCDSNGDGIGDIPGIIEKLDYILELRCNAIWINPCFDSPFVDAGYDIRNYYLVAPRYGTNEDLRRLFSEAHKRNMHVLLDLVPGHTSIESEWFKKSALEKRNEFTDRYIWGDSIWENFSDVGSITGAIRGGTERNAACAVNFFSAQPALNYGFAHPDKTKAWQQPMDAPGPMATREAIKDVMRFWLGMGCDGFRVDMAHSLVKSDPGYEGTIALWQDFSAFLKKEYPQAVMVSEWGEPDKSLAAGFQMDFLLHFGPSHYLELFRENNAYFSRKAHGDCKAFFDTYIRNRNLTKDKGGLICIPSGNHDMPRLARTLDPQEIKLAFAFLITMPGVPFIYYGDEIGMKYVEGLASVEGGYERTGSRSPMAFDDSTNAGFSSAPKEWLYIPQDESKSTINAKTELSQEDSIIREVQRLIALRKAHPAFGAQAEFDLLQAEDHAYPFAYRRSAEGETIYALFNTSDSQAVVKADVSESAKILYAVGTKDAQLKRNSEGNIVLPACCAVFLS